MSSSLFDLTGKVALITGSSKGIGRAIAEELARHGAQVVISSRKAEACQAVVDSINKEMHGKSGGAVSIPANISHKEELQQLPETIPVREFTITVENRDGGFDSAVVVTTITDPAVPQDEIAALYWRRWNCELDLRSIKQSMHLDVLRSKTPDMVAKEIFAHLLAWNLLRGVMTESAKRNNALPRQLSVKGCMQAIESFTPAMMATNAGEVLYDAMLTTVAAHRVGNRPGRLEPRYKKRRPAWEAYMTKPRNLSHRRLNSQARALR